MRQRGKQKNNEKLKYSVRVATAAQEGFGGRGDSGAITATPRLQAAAQQAAATKR